MPKLKVLKGTPLDHGYRFPAEWAKQAGVWFSWPRPEGISFPGKYHTIPENLCRIMHAIMEHGRELVHVNVPNENYEHIVREHLREARVPAPLVKKFLRFHFIRTNESWCRDHGPAFVIKDGPKGKRQKAIVDWGFNAWGGKYPPFDDDDAVPTRVAEELAKAGTPGFAGVFHPLFERGGGERVTGADGVPLRRVIMEGGAVEFNGQGTVLTTEACLLNKNRNPRMTRAEIEAFLREYYGQRHVCWLGDGIAGDDTDGHIDDLARFLDPRTIAVAVEDDPKDENFKVLKENLLRTGTLRDQEGRPFRVVVLPMPGVVEHDGQRLPATYLNFLFVNKTLLVPTFGHKQHDRVALETLQEHLPKHRVVGINCRELIWGLGAIHCLSQQEPA